MIYVEGIRVLHVCRYIFFLVCVKFFYRFFLHKMTTTMMNTEQISVQAQFRDRRSEHLQAE